MLLIDKYPPFMKEESFLLQPLRLKFKNLTVCDISIDTLFSFHSWSAQQPVGSYSDQGLNPHPQQ